MTWPVMKLASSLTRKATRAVSAGSPIRPSVNEAPSSARRSLVRLASRPVAELPGATALTVMRRDANSSAGPAGPDISDMNQLLDVVALGQAVAFVPQSIADRYGAADLVFVPVTDLTATEVVTAWPEVSRSPAVAAFVRVAANAAAELPRQAALA
jgi:DNA-binding transcriptional LysR family regulator